MQSNNNLSKRNSITSLELVESIYGDVKGALEVGDEVAELYGKCMFLNGKEVANSKWHQEIDKIIN